jgi:uncharacterized protein YndB with AHSA1/START domain
MLPFPETEIRKSIVIHASPAWVWKVLTDPKYMELWMGEPEMNIEVHTTWEVGSPFTIQGFHHVAFENKGTVIQFDPEKIMSYDFLSSVSRLPDKPENHTTVRFRLEPENGRSLLLLELSNFPTESIRQHVDFYWNATLNILKKTVESE